MTFMVSPGESDSPAGRDIPSAGHSTSLPLSLRKVDLSFVIPAFNEENCIGETVRRASAAATRLGKLHEIIVVDDGSSDATFSRAQLLMEICPVRVVRLSRNFGKEQAIMAGLGLSIGAAVVICDADLQEPLDCLETMLADHADGYEMIYAVRADRADESRVKRIATRAFYRLIAVDNEIKIPADARDFRLMDRKVVEALCALPERNRFMKGLYGWVGFRTKALPIVMAPRASGSSKFGFRRLVRLALTGLTSFTDWPLRIWTSIGFGLAVFSILYGLWILAKTLMWGNDLPGWATLAIAVFFLGGIQLISIGILGEYLGRIFTEVKGRPGFIVAEDTGKFRIL